MNTSVGNEDLDVSQERLAGFDGGKRKIRNRLGKRERAHGTYIGSCASIVCMHASNNNSPSRHRLTGGDYPGGRAAPGSSLVQTRRHLLRVVSVVSTATTNKVNAKCQF